MGDIVDLHTERAKRQAKADRAASRPPDCPKAAPLIDRDWDNELGRLVETIYAPGTFHKDRDFGDET